MLCSCLLISDIYKIYISQLESGENKAYTMQIIYLIKLGKKIVSEESSTQVHNISK